MSDTIQIADHGPSPKVWAPRSFVEMFRKGTGHDDLDVYWDPDQAIFDVHPHDLGADGQPLPTWDDQGCWVVCERRKTMEVVEWQGQKLIYEADIIVPVWAINGLYKRDEKLGNEGLPMELGSWMIDEYRASCGACRGYDVVLEEKNAAHRKAYHRQWDSTSKIVDDTEAGKAFMHGVKKEQEQHGVNIDREKIKRLEDKLHRKADERRRHNEAFLREMGL